MSRSPSINCPHCQAPTTTRTSRAITPTYREIYYQCSDVFCGHTFVCSLSVLKTLVPSQKPSAKVSIPFSPSIRQPSRIPLAANDDRDEQVATG